MATIMKKEGLLVLVPKLYEDLSVLHQNTMPVHSYFIPFSRQAEAASAQPGRETDSVIGIAGAASSKPPSENSESRPKPSFWEEYSLRQVSAQRLDSDRLQMLSGRPWLFHYYSSIYDLHDEFYSPGYQPDDTWTREFVPFCWQMRGYDAHQYTNIRYPFPFDPPFVPQNNPCGAYLHTFQSHTNAQAPCTFLHFEGVDSCFYVWLNGSYVGYSQVTHHTSEFDVTGMLREGENHLAVLVLKWCDGSYLEDQDKFRMSGIIRDVYLIRRPADHITDYVIETDLSEDFRSADLSVRCFFSREPFPVRMTLLNDAWEILASSEGNSHIHMTVHDPLLWNAETPNLYTLIMEAGNEYIQERVGFRRVCVQDGVLLLNGAPIKFRGVNRHESDPVTGSSVTMEHVWKDLCMIKENNFNAVRASHYPNVPYFYQFCDELGLYVIDEADNESHGTASLYFTEDDYAERMKLAHERIADNPAFTEATLDRVSSMVLRNRNRPSILVWSMGNECGFGCTFEKALRWTRQTDKTRLTHYESAYYLPRDRVYDTSDIDLFGRMYPGFEEVTDYLKKDPEKPLLLVEYCHSMGNSPGDFMEYRNLTEQFPGLCGGFVWEWCDHAVYKGKAANGKAMYWYGGDHGELQHDGNFCLDGLVFPDRRPHTGLAEYKNVHRPIRASLSGKDGLLTIGNYWDFLGSSCITAYYSLTKDGKEIQTGKFCLPEIPPHEYASVPLELDIPSKGRCFLTVTYVLNKPLPGLAQGHVLGFDELPVENSDGRNQMVNAMFPFAGSMERTNTAGSDEDKAFPAVLEEGTDLYITGSGFEYRFDTLSGRFTSWKTSGRELLKKPMDFNLWRAPTDNDRPLADLWKWERLDHTSTRAYEVSWMSEEGSAVILTTQAVAAVSVQPVLRIRAEYRIFPDGTIQTNIQAEKDRQVETLPRLGFRMFLDPALDTVDYFGIGPWESYPDKCHSGSHALYRAAVKDLHEDYIRPQENGSHCGCDFVRLTGDGLALTAAVVDGSTFSFNASLYTQEELETKRHNYELEPCGDTVLCIDHKTAGIGSKSCGPDLSPEYRVDADNWQFEFLLKPETTDRRKR